MESESWWDGRGPPTLLILLGDCQQLDAVASSRAKTISTASTFWIPSMWMLRNGCTRCTPGRPGSAACGRIDPAHVQGRVGLGATLGCASASTSARLARSRSSGQDVVRGPLRCHDGSGCGWPPGPHARRMMGMAPQTSLEPSVHALAGPPGRSPGRARPSRALLAVTRCFPL